MTKMSEHSSTRYSTLAYIGAILYYMLTSIVIQMMNKALFTTYNFKQPLVVAFVQFCFLCPCFYFYARQEIQQYQFIEKFVGVMSLACVKVVDVVLGLWGQGMLNVPMFVVLRRFTQFIILCLEVFVYKKAQTCKTWTQVMLMIFGALIAALNDLTFSLRAFLVLGLQDFATAGYLTMQKHSQIAKGMSTEALLFYYSCVCLIPLGLLCAFTGQFTTMMQFEKLYDPGFLFCLGMSGSLGILINHSTFVCTRVTEPLVTSVAGNLKNILSAVGGAIIFPDYQANLWNLVGLVMSMGAALWFGFDKVFSDRGGFFTVLSSLINGNNDINNGAIKKQSGSLETQLEKGNTQNKY
eukprot:TRINITY_DN28180_c5_g1_i1.p1 TRINITY_DN28180_c5_g1~~TRINITY_DN28180_c5_g1_i1.p1  ORF type:complete len:375 (-),score=28.07 TRINITY_DN28180_c5_g1_i1:313-1368(-)